MNDKLNDHDTHYSLQRIATIRSCYPQRFGIPRQAGLVKSATASINFEATQDNELALRDIASFSHLWVVYVFHGKDYPGYKPLVQPPRLGGKKNVGVYSTRSPNRLNPIGLSAVKFDRMERDDKEIKVHVSGGDFLDGTPVLDIKPYVPFVDAIEGAHSEWAHPLDDMLPVSWLADARSQLLECLQHIASPDSAEYLQQLIDETIAQDPRPAHERNKDGKAGQQWGLRVGPVDVRFGVEDGIAIVSTVVVP